MARRSWLPSLWSEERPGGDPFHQLRQEVDRLFDDFMAPALRPRSTGQAQMTISPEIDVAETEESIEITADMPGIDEKDIEVTVRDDLLTIKGEKKTEKEEKQKNYHLVERRYGSFHRSIRLPVGTDADKVTARFDKGVLRITVPKPKEAESGARRIAINSQE